MILITKSIVNVFAYFITMVRLENQVTFFPPTQMPGCYRGQFWTHENPLKVFKLIFNYKNSIKNGDGRGRMLDIIFEFSMYRK